MTGQTPSTPPQNVTVRFIGKDDGSTGYEVVLEQSDGSMHGLFRIEPGGDATAIGMMVGHLDMHYAAGCRWIFARSLPSENPPSEPT